MHSAPRPDDTSLTFRMRNYASPHRSDQQIVIICGHGRSGTSYLLDILDCHELTNCRNEPDQVSGSLFKLENIDPKKLTFGASDALRLTTVLDRLRLTKGERDRFCDRHKAYLSYPGRLYMDALLGKRKIRTLLSIVAPGLGGGEWLIPKLLLDPMRRSEVVLVAKINQAYQACASLLETSNSINVLHIVRDPIGMLRSWERRWLANQGPDKVLADNRTRLRQVANLNASWRERFGQIDKITLFESELLYWLYGNESLYTRFKSNPKYRAISYVKLVQEPVTVARGLFGSLGLKFDSDVAKRVSNLRNKLEPVHIPSVVPEDLTKLVSSSPIMDVLS